MAGLKGMGGGMGGNNGSDVEAGPKDARGYGESTGRTPD